MSGLGAALNKHKQQQQQQQTAAPASNSNNNKTNNKTTPAPSANGKASSAAPVVESPEDDEEPEEQQQQSGDGEAEGGEDDENKQGDDDDESAALGGGEETITPDPNNHSIRHILQHTWVMWYQAPPQARQDAKNYNNKPAKLLAFNTVEDFWGLVNNIHKPSELELKSAFYLFREGVEPVWESAMTGGNWEFKPNKSDLDQAWEFLMCALIGDQFEDSEEILGGCIMIRPKSRLELWTKTAKNKTACERAGATFKHSIEAKTELGYSSFADQKNNKNHVLYKV